MKIDDWVLYCRFPDVKSLVDKKIRAVILDVLDEDSFYDYKICLDDGTAKMMDVKRHNLFSLLEGSNNV